jgi:hypothetical protein
MTQPNGGIYRDDVRIADAWLSGHSKGEDGKGSFKVETTVTLQEGDEIRPERKEASDGV